MKYEIKFALLALLALVLLGGGITYAVVHWRECRRVHPWWYCAGEGR